MKKRVTRSDENAVRQLFQNTRRPTFFMGAALFKDQGFTVAWGEAADEKVSELLVTLEFDMTKQFPAIDELSKNSGVMGQITRPWCTIIGCKLNPVKTIEMEGKLMSFCRKHVVQLVTALGGDLPTTNSESR